MEDSFPKPRRLRKAYLLISDPLPFYPAQRAVIKHSTQIHEAQMKSKRTKIKITIIFRYARPRRICIWHDSLWFLSVRRRTNLPLAWSLCLKIFLQKKLQD